MHVSLPSMLNVLQGGLSYLRVEELSGGPTVLEVPALYVFTYRRAKAASLFYARAGALERMC